jgi:hypothetical protein
MAALYGRLYSERGKVITKTGHQQIMARLETWHGSVQTIVHKDGSFEVYVGDKYACQYLIASGNVNGDERYANPTGQLQKRAG